jgi:hypothetical protein
MLPLARHAVSMALALAFLMGGVGDALGSHDCPHHDGAGAAGEHRATGHDDHGAASDDHGPCTCVGRCHAGAAPSFSAPGAPQAAPVAEIAALSPAEPPPPARPAIVPFSLPWGNAPPTL